MLCRTKKPLRTQSGQSVSITIILPSVVFFINASFANVLPENGCLYIDLKFPAPVTPFMMYINIGSEVSLVEAPYVGSAP